MAPGSHGSSPAAGGAPRPPRRPPARPADRTREGRARRSAFTRLAVTHCLAVAGDTFVTMALAGSVFFSISPQAARGRVMLFLLLTMAPFAIVAPLLGPVLDRSRGGRRAVLILSASARAFLCLWMTSHLQGLLLFPLTFAVLVLSKAHMVSKSALVPTTVAHADELVEANSRLAVLAVLAGFVAAVPGALVLNIGFLGAPWVLVGAAGCFAAAAVSGMGIPRPFRATAPLEGAVAAGKAEAELHGATIRLSASAMAVLRAVVGFVTFLVAFSFRRTGAPAWLFGIVLAASMLGTFAGNAIAPLLRRVTHEERILAGALLAVAAAGFLAARADSRPAITALAATVGLSAAVGKLAFDTIVQRDAPDAVRGRTFARFETQFQLVWVLGAFVPVLIPISASTGMDLVALAAATTFAIYLASFSATSLYRRTHPAVGR